MIGTVADVSDRVVLIFGLVDGVENPLLVLIPSVLVTDVVNDVAVDGTNIDVGVASLTPEVVVVKASESVIATVADVSDRVVLIFGLVDGVENPLLVLIPSVLVTDVVNDVAADGTNIDVGVASLTPEVVVVKASESVIATVADVSDRVVLIFGLVDGVENPLLVLIPSVLVTDVVNDVAVDGTNIDVGVASLTPEVVVVKASESVIATVADVSDRVVLIFGLVDGVENPLLVLIPSVLVTDVVNDVAVDGTNIDVGVASLTPEVVVVKASESVIATVADVSDRVVLIFGLVDGVENPLLVLIPSVLVTDVVNDVAVDGTNIDVGVASLTPEVVVVKASESVIATVADVSDRVVLIFGLVDGVENPLLVLIPSVLVTDVVNDVAVDGTNIDVGVASLTPEVVVVKASESVIATVADVSDRVVLIFGLVDGVENPLLVLIPSVLVTDVVNDVAVDGTNIDVGVATLTPEVVVVKASESVIATVADVSDRVVLIFGLVDGVENPLLVLIPSVPVTDVVNDVAVDGTNIDVGVILVMVSLV